MKPRNLCSVLFCAFALLTLILGPAPRRAGAQDRLKTMPGYERFAKLSKEIPGSFKSGALAVTWVEQGKAFEFVKDGKRYHFDIAKGEKTEVPQTKDAAAEPPPGRRGRSRTGLPERGRQIGSVASPNGMLKAFHRDRNLWIADATGAIEKLITTDGSAERRIKYGTASWVYGEELAQRNAMWWSPDNKKLAYFRFDESKIKDYLLELDQTKLQSKVDSEPYPKAGTPNPIVDLFIYDLDAKTTTQIDVRDGKPFEDHVLGHYVYDISWSMDGSALLFNRTNRWQNVLELVAADPSTGKCRTVVHEEWLPSWVENSPTIRFLKDGKRFLWASERTGWRNYDVYDLSGKLLATLTNHEFEVGEIMRIDEEANQVDYMARSGDNPMKLQLHRVKLDGTADHRLTDPALNHSVSVAPDGKHYVDVAQTHDSPPTTKLFDSEGKKLADLAESDLTKYGKLGLKRVELFTFKAADGETDLYGMLHFPTDFDPTKSYPLLVSVYGGPATNAARETFALTNSLTEFGFLVASFDSRSAAGRGKHFLDAIYMRLGEVEIDDQAAGVKSLWERTYVDKDHVGIFGTSYGGTASAMCLLRYPQVFKAACASSAVTDFRNYDTIYTERYMRTPQENTKGYDFASLMSHVKNLKGRLMLYYGTADNNVHPSNTLQLIGALERAGKSFEVQVGPDRGHSAINRDRMMEFFIENLTTGKYTPAPSSSAGPTAASAEASPKTPAIAPSGSANTSGSASSKP